ncbi:MAG: DUF1080 domain-containing protein [Armatimonadetes bacterium]|jgi:hypothetical protein|nr:DUF1080 domain-containing protein [Armatimonadota bacterium]
MRRYQPALRLALVAVAGLCVVAAAVAQRSLGYQDTPLLPGGKWHVHDGERPQPRVVTPGTASTPEQPGQPPSDAIVLFDGTNLERWHDGKGQPSRWKVENGVLVATPGAGNLVTRDEFGDCQLHLEWAAPNPPTGEGQDRGNSGVILFGRYEIQVLDSYNARTYPDGQAAALYGQYPPLVNACRKPGEWQTYDIIFTAPRFRDGEVETPAYATVLHNGVVVHNHTALLGAVAHRALAQYAPHGAKGPLVLQDHGCPVRYRNLWIRELGGYDEQ